MITKWIMNFIALPKEIPACFTEAIENACKRIIERERMENAWKEVWAERKRSQALDKPNGN